MVPTLPTIFPWLGIELPVALAPPVVAALEFTDHELRAVQGMDVPLAFKVVKQDSATITKNVEGLSFARVVATEVMIKNKTALQGVDAGKLIMGSMLDRPLVKFDFVPTATLELNGKEEIVVAPAITIELVRCLLARSQISTGGFKKWRQKLELAGVVHREPAFAGTVKINVGDPPEKVSCGPVELPNGKSDFAILTCTAAADVQEGAFDVHLVSSAIIPGGAGQAGIHRSTRRNANGDRRG